jgi:uncharacterized peroxidase-related enzyme
MPRIIAPAIEAAPAASQPQLAAVKKQLGVAPNMFRTIAHSPAALEGYLSLSGALAKGSLDAATRERIALAVAEFNGCDYCLAAHAYLGKNVAKLSDGEIEANRRGRSTDAKADAAVAFAAKAASERGRVCDADISGVRSAGFTEADIIEIVAHVALNTLTNYVNNVARTAVDFPKAAALEVA